MRIVFSRTASLSRHLLRKKGRAVFRGAGVLSLASLGVLLLSFTPRAEERRQAPVSPFPLRVLIVGGGPDKENNQVAIESNVRYLNRLLPSSVRRTALFADGDPTSETVLYDVQARKETPGEELLHLLLQGREAGDTTSRFRRPNLGCKTSGSSSSESIRQSFSELVRDAEATPESHPHLLYFTGHGSENPRNLDNNYFDLWGKRERISVRELAQQIARLPKSSAMTLVMVQCYSGAFANLLFEEGDPAREALDRDIAGFFATVPDRVAAGCTSEVDEAEYRDFTSYFFAALCGRDRVGRRITGVDYNHDGRVGMDEAYCYALANDVSIDVPVCTSDAFLRRYVPLSDAEIFAVPYSKVRSWTTPAQRAALDALSRKLNREGEDRLRTAYERYRNGSPGKDSELRLRFARISRRFESEREEGRAELFRRWPNLQFGDGQSRKESLRQASTFLDQQQSGSWKALRDTDIELGKLSEEQEKQEISDSYLIRFVRLGKSIILAHRLQESGNESVQARFARLREAESRTLLPPVR